MAQTKRDLLRGARHRQGYGFQTYDITTRKDDRGSYARRLVQVWDFPETRAGRNEAIEFVRNSISDTHPDNPGLILQSIEIVPLVGRPGQGLAVCEYGPKNNVLYVGHIGHMEQAWYWDANGVQIPPDADGNLVARRKITMVRTIKFRHVFYKQSAPPILEAFVNTTNQDVYTIIDYGIFNPNVIRFEGVEFVSTWAPETPVWVLDYSLALKPDGWTEAYIDTTGAPQVRDMYPRTVFPPLPATLTFT